MVVQRGAQHARRLVDGLILLDGECRRLARGERFVDIRGRDVVAVQTKNSRLGMNLMGQTLFILKLLESIGPRSVESIALCALDGARLRPFLEAHEGCKVVVCPSEVCQLAS